MPDIQAQATSRHGGIGAGDPDGILSLLSAELHDGLALYWQTAGRILEGSGIHLTPPDEGVFSLERNFFSALFLYSYVRTRIAKTHRIFYAAANQCLRGMVTGCDNILDDEYKRTLETDLPETGTRFRSVLDIMVSDRVLFEILLDMSTTSNLPPGVVKKALSASLQALTRSGAQEASEEAGITGRRLSPQAVLTTVHHYKTGLLFQCPWALPAALETSMPQDAGRMKDALYQVGIGCQILDDMVDLAADIRNRRHNYVASLIEWGEDRDLKHQLADSAASESAGLDPELLKQPLGRAYRIALTHLDNGLRCLFHKAHQHLVGPAVAFIVDRIGADRIYSPAERQDT